MRSSFLIGPHHLAEIFADLFYLMTLNVFHVPSKRVLSLLLVLADHSSANSPDWISFKTAFILFLLSLSTTRGPRVSPPYRAVSLTRLYMPVRPYFCTRSVISFSSCRHSKYATS